jgi:hypothetical protein
MRTPRQNDMVIREARNNYNLMNVRTPLVGGENTVLSESDF